MIAASTAVVQPGGVLRRVHSEPPVTIRQVFTEDPSVCALCIVGSAAGPLAGDAISFDLTVAEGAAASLTSAGALLAQGRGPAAVTAVATVRTHVVLGPLASLVAQPQPVVVCAGSQLDIHLEIELDPTATLSWRELVVLGRSGEMAGSVTLSWDVRRGGRPLLRQRTDLTAKDLWPGLLRGHRVLATELRVGPDVETGTTVQSELAVAQRIDDGCELLTVIDDDSGAAVHRLDALAARTSSRSMQPSG